MTRASRPELSSGDEPTLGERFSTVAEAALSWPVLAAGLLTVTALAAGPLDPLDKALDQPWYEWLLPQSGPFWAEVVDPLARQAVVVPLLGLVAVVLAWRHWSLRPVMSAAAAEFGAVVVGGTMKVGFARPSPKLADPTFLHGGLLADGWRGISYPSGHALEAILLYGAIVFLIARYTAASRRSVRLLGAATALITLATVCQSLYMQWHWASDLGGGLLLGALILRVVAILDRTLWVRLRLDLPPARRLDLLPGFLRSSAGAGAALARSGCRLDGRGGSPRPLEPPPDPVLEPGRPGRDPAIGATSATRD
jgi:undecaprenyl-diphosphatase